MREAPPQQRAEHEQHDDVQRHRDMMQRGVTRMAHAGPDGMSDSDRRRMQQAHHQQVLWVDVTVILLGIWLAISPFLFGYTNPSAITDHVARVTADRHLPSIAFCAAAMTWSDVLSGALLVVFGVLSLKAQRLWAPWAAGVVGIWLLFAPLIFWAPTAAAYAIDTLIGILVIALTILIPGMPGMVLIMKMGPTAPPGWSYNPSSWLQRAPVIAFGWIGFFIARYLSAYQLGYVDYAWDPFFGDGTMRILESSVSKVWPISDAGLGAVAYTLEALMGFMGGTARWRTMPWMVLFFGILVVPLGLVSIALVVLQPVAVGTWCTLCLLTAAAMLAMIPLTLDEVLAMIYFMVKAVRDEGKSFWRTFWLGDTIEGGQVEADVPGFDAPLSVQAPAMVRGATAPWPLIVTGVVGLWLMATPDLLGMQGGAADSNHLVGAAIVCVAVIAMAEVTRSARFLDVALGAWVVVAPWLLASAPVAAIVSNVVVGLLVIGLSIPRGAVTERYGGWGRYIR